MSLAWSLAAVPFLIALNAFFVAAEYAVVAITPAQVEALRLRGRGGTAAAVGWLKGDPASAIGAIQVCITMTNLLLGWIGEPAMSELLEMAFGPVIRLWHGFTKVSTALSFVVVTLLTVVFSELLPKALTLRHAAAAATVTAVPVVMVQTVVRPLVWVMNAMANAVTKPLGLGSVEELEGHRVTADELRMMAVQAGEEGALSPGERSLVLNSLAIGRRKGREIMVPRTRVAYLNLAWSMDENRRVMDQQLFSRLPLCDGGLDNVVGVVHTTEFFAAYHAEGDTQVLSLIARPPVFLPETASLVKLLAAFHESETEILFLASEYGGVEGIITLKDVVDELVGEIREAHPARGTNPL